MPLSYDHCPHSLGYLTCVLVIVVTTYALNWSTFKQAMKQQYQQELQKKSRSPKPTAAPQVR
ncbi:hypothetical protein FY528_15005 [Hymenobacter lutimineralis]|uniref:Uncharacterized protein n=1 Tax=Hymenobacter lutimineralis TaxID=2606448 RepID=A0A5D6UV26_9BACT|nr:hypothetical protein [Hymenobacter lutimineralis]TYZ07373.1 hypothetical protein FY528_15005 [Hymenobacter lutimineralis]